jgi:hypothetical protein
MRHREHALKRGFAAAYDLFPRTTSFPLASSDALENLRASHPCHAAIRGDVCRDPCCGDGVGLTKRPVSRARRALQLQRLDLPTTDEPFAALILCTADRQKVDKRTRSKWSRVLRYSAEYKSHSESLAAFIRRKGGINECAERFTRCFGRSRRSCQSL